MIGYGFFLLITALLVFAWRREQMRNQELFKEKGDLIDENLKSLDIVKESLERVKQLAFERIDLRKQFIEQSELATEWRQKHDRLEIDYVHLRDECDSVQNLNNEFHVEILNLESELDRGNEMITWMKADLEKAYEMNTQNEGIIVDLLSKGLFPNEKGEYKKQPWYEHGFNTDLGNYLESFVVSRSNVIKQFDLLSKGIENWTSDLSKKIDNAGEKLEEDFNQAFEDDKRNSVATIKMGLTLEDALRAKNDVIPYVLENGGGALKNMLDAVSNPSSHVFDFPNSIPKDEPLAGAIDWNVPQAFP